MYAFIRDMQPNIHKIIDDKMLDKLKREMVVKLSIRISYLGRNYELLSSFTSWTQKP